MQTSALPLREGALAYDSPRVTFQGRVAYGEVSQGG